jgi:hypothetical protein
MTPEERSQPATKGDIEDLFLASKAHFELRCPTRMEKDAALYAAADPNGMGGDPFYQGLTPPDPWAEAARHQPFSD